MYKSFIIHLSKIESSLDSANVLKKQLENFGIETVLFEGSYGNEVYKEYQQKNRVHHPWSFKGPDLLLDDQWKKESTRPGLIGCFDSHYRLWKHCAKINEPIFIWEDDARVTREFYPVEWKDVLSLACSHQKKMRRYWQYLLEPEGEPRAESYGQASMPGNAGYLIKPHAAKILVGEYKNSFLPADNAINQHLVTIEIHSHMMGQAEERKKTKGKSSLIRTDFWDSNERNI
jgi:GR25 family glycosyltransferase involved in LPS biosynthesis